MSDEKNCECTCESKFKKTTVNLPLSIGVCVDVDESAGSGDGNNDFRCVSYSFDEQWTGKYWVNGKKIYQKTIDFGALPNNTNKDVPHGIENLETALDFYGYTTPGDGTWAPLPNPHESTKIINVGIHTKNVRVKTNGNLTNYTETMITVYYTCTDR